MAKNIFILAILIVLFFFMFSNPKYVDNKVITKIDTLIQIKEYTKYKKGQDITYKVLDSNLGLYSFTTNVCEKHYEEIHNFKERITGDFSVFFKDELDKSYHM